MTPLRRLDFGAADHGADRPLPAGLARAHLALVAVLACAPGVATAAAVAGPGGTAEQASRIVIAAPVPGVNAPALGLVAARIDAVDAAAASITVRGLQVPLHLTQLRVLGAGGSPLGGPGALRAGMQVRFALEPESPAPAAGMASAPKPGAASAVPPRRIVVIYVDAAP